MCVVACAIKNTQRHAYVMHNHVLDYIYLSILSLVHVVIVSKIHRALSACYSVCKRAHSYCLTLEVWILNIHRQYSGR